MKVPAVDLPPPLSTMNSVVIESVDKIFRPANFFWFGAARAETHALKEVSLNAAAGEVLALLGPNGSGKSTTLKLVSTMLLPDRGRVFVGGADTQLQSQAVRRQVGFALASERSFFPRFTARENLDFFAALEDLPRRERPHRVESVLRDVGLQDAGSVWALLVLLSSDRRFCCSMNLPAASSPRPPAICGG